MIRRICSLCGMEMTKELTPDGPGFFCENCESYSPYDEFDMDPYCPECGAMLEFCAKCSQAFYCNKCNAIVSRKKIIWKEK